jgi:hypothetical protein
MPTSIQTTVGSHTGVREVEHNLVKAGPRLARFVENLKVLFQLRRVDAMEHPPSVVAYLFTPMQCVSFRFQGLSHVAWLHARDKTGGEGEYMRQGTYHLDMILRSLVLLQQCLLVIEGGACHMAASLPALIGAVTGTEELHQ